jgi:alanine racemase
MVKADGYGHGALAVATTALKNGADWLGVALPEEAWALRQAGIRAPILVLGPIAPAQVALMVEADLFAAVFTQGLAQALDRAAARAGRRAVVHVKVDTGMGRIGVPAREAVDFLGALRRLPNLEIQGIYTHFATADDADKSFTRGQVGLFMEICARAAAQGISIPLKHLSNSAAILDLPETFQDLVRPGIMIYGCYPSETVQRDMDLIPAMAWKTQVAFVKDILPGESLSYGRSFVAERPMRVATLPLGYGDGFSRSNSNRGEVLIRGLRASVVGLVCMDMTIVDVTHVPGVEAGDEVVVFGRQMGATLPVEEVARRLGTISYEILCGVGARVPRRYVGANSEPSPPKPGVHNGGGA